MPLVSVKPEYAPLAPTKAPTTVPLLLMPLAEVSMAPFTLAFGSVIAFGSEIVVNVKGPAEGSATPTAQTAAAIPMALSERIQATPNRARRECYHTAATNPDLQRKSPANFPRPHIVGRLLTGI